MFIDIFLYAQQSRLLSIAKTKLLMLCREIIVVCSENHRKHGNTLCGQTWRCMM